MNKLEAVELVKKTGNFLSNEVNQIKQGVNLALFHLIEKNDLERLGIDTSDFEELDDHIHLQTYFQCKVELLSQGDLSNNAQNDVLFEILADTKSFLGRKFLFEHYIDEKIEDFKVYDSINYTPLIDYVLREFYICGSISIQQLLLSISENTFNTHEISLVFHLISQQLGGSYHGSKKQLLGNIFSIVDDLRQEGKPYSKGYASRIKKTARMTRILGEDFDVENIKKNLELYTYVPNLLSNNYGEGSQIVGVFNGIAKSYKPARIKVIEKNTKVAEKVYNDAARVSYFDDFILGCREISKNIKSITGYNIFIKYWGQFKERFGEFKLDSVISLKQKRKSDKLDFIDQNQHKQLMKKYLYLMKILKSINSSIITTDQGIDKKQTSQIYTHIKARIKGKTISPVINKSWPFLARVKIVDKIIKNSKFLKLKTLWFIIMYKVVNKGIDIAANTDVVKRYKINTSLYQGYNIEASPELFNFLVENADLIHQIDFQIAQIRKMRLLGFKKKQLENKNIQSGSQGLDDEILLIQKEIIELEQDTKEYNIQEDILSLKIKFLELLEQSSQGLHTSFKEKLS